MTTSAELSAGEATYRALRRFLFALPPDEAHRMVIGRLAALDRHPGLCDAAARYRERRSLLGGRVGRVILDSPLILAAGLVKGEGFLTEDEAMGAVAAGRNIIPGWRSAGALLGPVEMGTFTPRPRLGNQGQVLWRHTEAQSLLNRVGLRNPGAAAAAAFLGERSEGLPDVYGISIASDPDQADPARRVEEAAEAVRYFAEAGVRPSWTTVNVSCPNVDQGYDLSSLPGEVGDLCRAVRAELWGASPLWVKVAPDVGRGRYGSIAQAAVEGGAEAIVATNTAPGRLSGTEIGVGVGGASLHGLALEVVEELDSFRTESGTEFEIVGCGGVLDGQSYRDFLDRGAAAVQYWSALVFRGPTAPALILAESEGIA